MLLFFCKNHMFRLTDSAHLCVEIKKSRFIATCIPIASTDDVPDALQRLRADDATHNCWAWRFGDAYRFCDDGEPGSSAGRPILAAIDGQSFDAVLAHVTRYFGGIKLGVGGLVRAYGNTVAECLRTAQKEEIVPRTVIGFSVAFADTYAIYGIITQQKLIKIDERYTEQGVFFELSVESNRANTLRQELINLTRGQIRFANASQ